MDTPFSGTPMTGTPAMESQDSAKETGKTSVFANPKSVKGIGRRALLDMTNDSPIAGLAFERADSTETPLSKSKSSRPAESLKTPGTGETLLRYQVKSLLKKVESDHIKLAPSLRTLCHLNGYNPSPSTLVAPTPANTPDSSVIPNGLTTNDSSISKKTDKTIDIHVELGSGSNMEPSDNFPDTSHQEVIDAVESATDVSPEKPITRALLFDSPEKEPEASISSPRSVISVDSQRTRNMDDDDASEWSVQVNVSSPGPEQADDYVQGENEFLNNEEEDDDDGEVIGADECEQLCQGLNKVSVHDNEGLPAFEGKHTRFVYNSDDELEGEEVVSELPSPSLIRLKGLPTPKGKHLRFSEDDDGAPENTSN